jgi:hypothetical protein
MVRGYRPHMILLARVDENVPSTPEAGKITVYYVHHFSGVPTALVTNIISATGGENLSEPDRSLDLLKSFPSAKGVTKGRYPYISEQLGRRIPLDLFEYYVRESRQSSPHPRRRAQLDIIRYLDNIVALWVAEHNESRTKTAIPICANRLNMQTFLYIIFQVQ